MTEAEKKKIEARGGRIVTVTELLGLTPKDEAAIEAQLEAERRSRQNEHQKKKSG